MESRLNKMYEEHRGKLRERRRQDVKDQVRTVKYIPIATKETVNLKQLRY